MKTCPSKKGPKSRSIRSEQKTISTKPKSVRELGFFGMWKDRDDIGTGVEYVNRIRKYRREPKGK